MKLVKQRRRNFAPKRYLEVVEEVDKLLQAGFYQRSQVSLLICKRGDGQ
jgi:hypothetical protein